MEALVSSAVARIFSKYADAKPKEALVEITFGKVQTVEEDSIES